MNPNNGIVLLLEPIHEFEARTRFHDRACESINERSLSGHVELIFLFGFLFRLYMFEQGTLTLFACWIKMIPRSIEEQIPVGAKFWAG